jgi:hypothetical protein
VRLLRFQGVPGRLGGLASTLADVLLSGARCGAYTLYCLAGGISQALRCLACCIPDALRRLAYRSGGLAHRPTRANSLLGGTADALGCLGGCAAGLNRLLGRAADLAN